MVTDFIISLDKSLLGDIAIQLCNTLILCFILCKLLYKPVLNFLKNRKEGIKKDIDDAQTMLKDAENLKKEYELKLKNIDKERLQIIDDANKYAQERQNQIIDEAKKEADLIKNRAYADIEKAQQKAKDDVKKQIIEVSSLMAGKFILTKMDESEKEKLFNDTVKDLEEATWQR